jgi:hypothetical protein
VDVSVLQALFKEVKRPLKLRMLNLTRNRIPVDHFRALLRCPHLGCLSDLEMDGHEKAATGILKALRQALKNGALPGLMSFSITGIHVDDDEAQTQTMEGDSIERLRPWVKTFIRCVLCRSCHSFKCLGGC